MYNIQGLTRYKLSDADLINYITKFDIILLCETWTSKKSAIGIPGYEPYFSHRPKLNKNARRCSGGVILYVKENILSYVKIVKDDIPDMVWVKLDKNRFGFENDLLLCLCYVSPNTASCQSATYHDVLDQIVLDIAKFECDYDKPLYLVAGDFNSRVAAAPDYVEHDDFRYLPLPDEYTVDDNIVSARSTADATVNAQGKRLLELCKMCNLRIFNGRFGSDGRSPRNTCFTYNGTSTVDLILGSPPLFSHALDFVVHEPMVFSDHAPVSLMLSVIPKQIILNYTSKVEKTMWNDEKLHMYQQNLAQQNCTEMFNKMIHVIESNDFPSADIQHAVNEAVQYFTDGVRLASDPLFLKSFKIASGNEDKTNTTTRPPPWADEEWYESKKNFLKSRDKVNRSPSDINLRNMSEARRNYKKLSRQKQYVYDQSETTKLLNAKKSNVKLYWKMLTGQNNSSRNCPISTGDMYNHFLKLNNPENDFFVADNDISDEVKQMIENDLQYMYQELDISISTDEVKAAIRDLKKSKSGGVDLLINELFVYDDAILQPYLVYLFNFVFESGVFPETWSEGLLAPLHKKGSKSSPDNYRGITLLSVLGKIFTRILNKRLDLWAEKYEIYIEAQYGFRRDRGTTDSIFILNQIINQVLENGKKLYAFFVDFSKAFDRVVHDNLWYKLLKNGVSGKIFNIIQSMYKCLKTRVVNNGEKSQAFYCQLGVRQGECLSPFLFALYINDIEQCLESPTSGITLAHMRFLLLLYADDVVIFADSETELQSAINRLHAYCSRWKLQINLSKSYIIVFGRGRANRSQSWTYGDTSIPVISKVKYLGLFFSSSGSSYQTQLTLSEQARKAVFSLHKKLRRFKCMPISATIDLFDKFIDPILNYGCEAWGFHPAPDIERVQLQFYKRILGVKGSTQNDFVYGILGRVPMVIKRQCQIVKYWTKIILGKKSLYVNSLYMSSLASIDKGNPNNWAYNLRNLLCKNGFGDIWRSQSVFDPDGFCNAFRIRLYDIYRQEWSSRLCDSSRAIFYRQIVTEHTFNQMLDTVSVPSHRISLIRLICSSHRLGIETGRWQRPQILRENRKCSACNKLDDEYHFLLECSLFVDYRKKFIKKYFWKRPSMEKCTELLNTKNKKELRNIAKYTWKCFSIRIQ